MKTLYALILFLIVSMPLISQSFLWAESYEIPNCNEVAALSVDADGNIFIVGVHDASVYLPYTGNAYIKKVSPQGTPVWTEYLVGNLIIGDMATVGSNTLIIGQANGTFTYRDEQYGQSQHAMFAMMIDADGNYLWHFTDDTKYGVNSNISVGNNGSIALHIRGQYNLGDWILIVDDQGNIQNSKLLSATETLVVDMAYFDDRIYLNGGYFGSQPVYIDTIAIERPPIENASFVLALDENLYAEWIYVDTTINNRDGRIVANESGVYSYQSVLRSPFLVKNLITKFDFSGQLIAEIEPPIFSNAVAMYPDMVVTPTMLGFFSQNAFNFNSHKVSLFDHELNLFSEKVIEGTSDLYSGQIANHGDDVFVAHVFSGELSFDDELTLPYSGTGKVPYIAIIGESEFTIGFENHAIEKSLSVFPNPTTGFITLNYSGRQLGRVYLTLNDLKGIIVKKDILNNFPATIDVSQLSSGIYFLQLSFEDGSSVQKKIVKK